MATPEYVDFRASCTDRLLALQGRSCFPALAVSAEVLRERVRVVLHKALRAGLLKTAPYEVSRLLRPISVSAWQQSGKAYGFSCGPTSDREKDPKSKDCLVRDDDAVLSFSVTVGQKPGQPLALLAYRFDLTFPDSERVGFVRFDLDRPEEGHSNQGLRAHIHPGLADGRLPSPVLDPVEALHFLLVHLRTQ